MPLNYEALRNWKIPETSQTITKRDTMLYALGIGLGEDPIDERQLRFVFEKDLRAFPSMAVILCPPGPWIKVPGTGVTAHKMVHGGQAIFLHKPLPIEGELLGRSEVVDIYDKGSDRGAIVIWRRKIFEKTSGDHLCTLVMSFFCRADGGFGGPNGPSNPPHRIPDRTPDATCHISTLPQLALLYRLSGDFNPLHADPDFAKRGGFDRPILQGLCTLGIATRAILKTFCDYDPDPLKSLELRFSAPVFPGERIRTDMWRDGDEVSFRCVVPERDALVINNGRAVIGSGSAQGLT